VPLRDLHERADVPAHPRDDLRGVKLVVIAEDDPDTGRLIGQALEERLGVRTQHVTNGALVIDALAAAPPDLLILDVSLPGLNGVDVFDLVRASGHCADVPVLFVTAAPERAQMAIERRGVCEVLTKPFDLAALVARVDLLLAKVAVA
jgi:DNA-binding response OmpR family regulator